MIIIPTYNEEGSIENVVSSIFLNYPNESIIVVDGLSSDKTRSILLSLKQKYKNLFLLLEDKRTGLGFSYLDALRFVLNDFPNERFIITIDADCSHPISKIGDFIENLEFVDMVVGSRYVEGGGIVNWSFNRRFISFFGNLYAKILLLSKINDLTSGFVGYSMDIIRSVNLDAIKTDGYGFQIEMKYACSRLTDKIVEIPIIFTDRINGFSKFSREIFIQAIFLPWKIVFKNIINSK